MNPRRSKRGKPFQARGNRLRVNEGIRISRVRVIDEDGAQIGIMHPTEALLHAKRAGLDLVEISPHTNPPVCRILDYGKYQYEQAKKERETRKTHKQVETKGVRIGFKIGDYDLRLRKERTEKFLHNGNKVRVEIALRGREKAYQDMAREKLESFIQSIEAPHHIEEHISKSPRGLAATIAPKP